MPNLSEFRELLGLTLVPNIGARRIKLLLQRFDTAEEVLAASVPELKRIEGIGQRFAHNIHSFDDWEEVDRILEETEKAGAWLIDWKDANYPALLKHIYDPPILMWGLGDPLVLNEPMMAMVGTRRNTSYGRRMAEQFATELVNEDLTIVSGLALGIDTASHESTIEAGGRTVAVLGSGIDWIYPSQNKKLAKEIIQTGGAILSEFPPGTKPDAGNFPPRNRIVSGMSQGVVVIESGIKGGSMITARVALDQNREVFAVPHQATAINGSGCNRLIQRGWAKLVLSAEDIMIEFPDLEQYEPDTGTLDNDQQVDDITHQWEKHRDSLSEQEVTICEYLSSADDPLHIDDLADQTDVQVHVLTSLLLQLEMQDLVEQQAGKYFKIR
ncbi:MAG: DNA-processing protein DprA [Bacteroidota bacterium]